MAAHLIIQTTITTPTKQVEALQEEVARLERLVRDVGAFGDAAEAQLADAKRVLVDHALGAGLPRYVGPD